MLIEEIAEMIMIMEDYECKEKKKFDNGVDIIASNGDSEDKILLRLIINPRSKSGFVGIDAITEINEILKSGNFDKGILISNRFTDSVRNKTINKKIRIVSENFKPLFESQEIYAKIQDLVDNLCIVQCGKIPKKESDCNGYSNGSYTCNIRKIEDDSVFHLNHKWNKLLQNDLRRIIKMNPNIEVQ
ncbi:MAG: restriction endonuclease [Candidatus Bathyarchaeota archaeon]